MKITRQNNELTISIPDNIMSLGEIQELIDYIKFRSITSKSKASQKDIDNLSKEIDESWWNKNKPKFIK
ncbi:MAG: hypothetical protein COZ21_02865 [Bacteroidetes bacterium CG_4_10_14_3_um_filter_31_20]|nr:MAG: hypothetical protein COZ21_02865 [Bacteroidetes bacterium CG_4_10_14_3_um_filter_31_20]